ncbi:MAG: hypothetical protein Q9195_005664 [Heterodermia aff. obscurata]
MDVVKQARSAQRLSQFDDLSLEAEKAEEIEIIKSAKNGYVVVLAHGGSKPMASKSPELIGQTPPIKTELQDPFREYISLQ